MRSGSPIAACGRVVRHGAASERVVAVSLAVTALGHHGLAGMPWIDSFRNASMLLGGMGPVGDVPTDAGKLFASFYAPYAGLFFIVAGGILMPPTFDRILHPLHLEEADDDEPPDPGAPPR